MSLKAAENVQQQKDGLLKENAKTKMKGEEREKAVPKSLYASSAKKRKLTWEESFAGMAGNVAIARHLYTTA
jgi:hypothetical protein